MPICLFALFLPLSHSLTHSHTILTHHTHTHTHTTHTRTMRTQTHILLHSFIYVVAFSLFYRRLYRVVCAKLFLVYIHLFTRFSNEFNIRNNNNLMSYTNFFPPKKGFKMVFFKNSTSALRIATVSNLSFARTCRTLGWEQFLSHLSAL